MWTGVQWAFWPIAEAVLLADTYTSQAPTWTEERVARVDPFGHSAQLLREADPQRAPRRQSLGGQSLHGRLTVQLGTVGFRLQAEGIEADHRGHQPRGSRGSSTRESWPNLAASTSKTNRVMTIRMISMHPASLCTRYLSNADVS